MWQWLINNGLTALAFGGYAVLGLLVLLGYFKQDDSRRKESDDLADTLINRLKEQVDQMATAMAEHTLLRNKELKEMTGKIESQQREIHQLQGQNDAYLKIITLRDPASEKVFKEAPQIFDIAKENNVLAKANGDAIRNLANIIARFLETFQPLLVHLEAGK